MSDKINIKILVAPLDWGLGHATRCIPIITQLLQLGCKVIIATEGAQEKLLKTEFPNLVFVSLPGYQINYSINKRFFPLKIILQLPKISRAIKMERRWLKAFLAQTPVDAVISDNRYGLHHPDVPSVFITHQLLIKGPFSLAEKLMQKLNYSLIEKFSHCWVPDQRDSLNLAGSLSHPAKFPSVKVEYLGGLSRLNKRTECKKEFDLLVIISGPEPQRSLLEEKLLIELSTYVATVLFVRGVPGHGATMASKKNITFKNHLPGSELEDAFCKSELVISRSGYTTVMDICKLQKKAVLIPTPGQTEQEYLAAHLEKQGWCIAMQQHDFSLNKLLQRVKQFEYKLPQLNMEAYKDVVSEFVNNLKS